MAGQVQQPAPVHLQQRQAGPLSIGFRPIIQISQAPGATGRNLNDSQACSTSLSCRGPGDPSKLAYTLMVFGASVKQFVSQRLAAGTQRYIEDALFKRP